MTQILTKEEQTKDSFVKILKGKEVPRDMFDTIIQIGDIIAYGTGTQSAAGINFARVEKINYNGVDRVTGDEKLSSITVLAITDIRSWKDTDKTPGWRFASKRQAIQSISSTWVVTTPPPAIAAVVK